MRFVPQTDDLPKYFFGTAFLVLGILNSIRHAASGDAFNLIDGIAVFLFGVIILRMSALYLTRSRLIIFSIILLASLVNLGVLNGRLTAFLFFVGCSVYLFARFIRVLFGSPPKPLFTKTNIPKPEEMLQDNDPYQSHLSHRAYLERDAAGSTRKCLAGTDPTWGIRWKLGPLIFEHYVGDTEPPADKTGPWRIVLWQPLRPVPMPKGWHLAHVLQHIQMTGFTKIDPIVPYEKTWSAHARRHLAKWRKETEWEMYQPTLEEFIAAYRHAKQGRVLKAMFVKLLEQTTRSQPGLTHIWGVRRRGVTNAPLQAGFVCLDVPEAKESRHFISFILPDAKESSAGVGMMDAWYQHAIKQGFHTLDFGVFWYPGDPESWQGFSRFKSQFNITYILYPRQRFKMAGRVFGKDDAQS